MPNRERERIRILQQQLLDRERLIRDLKDSKSWKITRPLRWLHSLLKPVLGSQINRDAQESLSNNSKPLTEPTTVDGKDAYIKRARSVLEFFLSSGNRITVPCSTNPKLSILIVAYNRAELTLTCFTSLVDNLPPKTEVIAVNNGSTDETSDLLNQIDGLRIIQNNENMHFIFAANQAANEAKGEYILFLNNDTQVLTGSIQSALNTIESSSDIGAVGAKLILPDGSLQEAGSILWNDGSCAAYGRGDNPFDSQYMFRRNVDYCSAAFLLTKRNLFLSSGGFDEAFKPAYYEDADYCLRVWKSGMRVVYDPTATLIHHEFGSSSSPSEAIQLQETNREIFANKYLDHLSKQPEAKLVNFLDARTHSHTLKVLFIDDRVPHSSIGSGFPRAHAMLLSLIRLKCFVTCYPMSFINEDWTSVYSDLPREIEVILNAGQLSLSKFLEQRKGYYNAIICSRPANMEILQELRHKREDLFQDLRVIYDSEALISLRDVALRRARGEKVSENELQKAIRKEVALAKNVDALLSTSRTERETWLSHGSAPVMLLGHCTPSLPTSRPFSQRKGFLFIGAIHDDMSPNADAVRWFVSNIFPLLRNKLGDIELTIAGINDSDAIAALEGNGIRIAGYLEDLTECYEIARVFVAPLRYSAGIPIKVLNAVSHGLPVVATTLLGAQLGWKDGMELLLADTEEDFAENCVKLYSDPDLWHRIRENGLNRIRKEYSKESFDQILKNLLF